MFLRVMRRSYGILSCALAALAALIAISVSEGWLAVVTVQDSTRWICLVVVAIGLSIASLLMWMQKVEEA